jgi:hypothetical protein
MKSLLIILAASILAINSPCAAADQIAGIPDANRIFDFHSEFWVNLHHRLYHESQHHNLNADRWPAWNSSVQFYREHMANRDLLFDPAMMALKNSLEDQGGSATLLPGPGLTPDVIAVLEKAALAYRADGWPQDDRSNRQWITAVLPLVNEYGSDIAREISHFYETAWQSYPIRADVSGYANWASAYTTDNPTRITISSQDPANQGSAALEIVFHEASHGISDRLEHAISAECRKQNLVLPRQDLWHAVLFYTTGEVVRRHLGDYTPYAERNGLWKRGWLMYLHALENDWQPYLDGKVPFDSAVAALVKDAGESKRPTEGRLEVRSKQ